VLEIVEGRALAAGTAHGDLDDALTTLDLVFDPAPFGPEPLASARRRRAEGNLRSLYDRWPGKGRVVAVEHRLETEIGGVRWVGVADRIEAHGGLLTVVDYKTSSAPVTQAEAASSLQLGVYLLAARTDPYLRSLGEPVRAELWYPWAGRNAKSVPTRCLELGHVDDVAVRLVAAAAGIRTEKWPTAPSDQCDRCGVRSLCPAQPDGREGWVA
jgi:RecB family exonuclease